MPTPDLPLGRPARAGYANHRFVDVLGVRIDGIDVEGGVDRIQAWMDDDEQHYVCVSNVHCVMMCQDDPDLRDIHNGSGLTTPDGTPMVWAGRRVGLDISRVCGRDLLLGLSERAAREGWSVFYYGGDEGVADDLAVRLEKQYPGLQTAGTYCPPFRDLTPQEDAEIVDMINNSGADIVWVGLGAPKQERWMASHIDQLDARTLVGIGAAFDFFTDRLRIPPWWVQRTGFEWLFRLVLEPRRLWRRYLINNPRYLWNLLWRPPELVDPPRS